jgi:hypothetical protein
LFFNNSIYTIAKLIKNLIKWQKNLPKNDIFDLLNVKGLSSHQLRQLAHDCCFIKRQSRKIDTTDFLTLMCLESQKGSPSYNDLVSRFDSVYHVSASKQALWKKVNEPCVLFFQTVLAQIIKSRMSEHEIQAFKALGKYDRVIIQDSTIIKLPLRLFQVFSGVSNQLTSVCNARIQGVYDLLSGRFLHFSIDPYSKNDLTAAPELELHQADLVLRDRGYLTTNEIKRHVDAGADCIYRHKQKILYMDPSSGKPIHLLALLERNGSLDIEVCLNNEGRTKVRLLALPVSEKVANNRRMKAKKEMKGRSPNKDLLKLMDWTIFITTIPRSEADFNQILKIYRFRWQIEIIFKTWKSHLHFAKVHNVSYYQLQVLLTARLIMIVICTHKLFIPYCTKISHEYNRDLSMMKFMNYLLKNPEKILELLKIIHSNHFGSTMIYEKLIRYCAYDKRKRLNLKQLEVNVLLS